MALASFIKPEILAGDPWFPHGAVLLPSPACMALCVFVFPFSLFGFLFVFGHTRM